MPPSSCILEAIHVAQLPDCMTTDKAAPDSSSRWGSKQERTAPITRVSMTPSPKGRRGGHWVTLRGRLEIARALYLYLYLCPTSA